MLEKTITELGKLNINQLKETVDFLDKKMNDQDINKDVILMNKLQRMKNRITNVEFKTLKYYDKNKNKFPEIAKASRTTISLLQMYNIAGKQYNEKYEKESFMKNLFVDNKGLAIGVGATAAILGGAGFVASSFNVSLPSLLKSAIIKVWEFNPAATIAVLSGASILGFTAIMNKIDKTQKLKQKTKQLKMDIMAEYENNHDPYNPVNPRRTEEHVIPEPVIPEPVIPEPVNPEPVGYEKKEKPVIPEPVNPEPINPGKKEDGQDKKENPDKKEDGQDKNKNPDKKEDGQDKKENPDKKEDGQDKKENPDKKEDGQDKKENPDKNEDGQDKKENPDKNEKGQDKTKTGNKRSRSLKRKNYGQSSQNKNKKTDSKPDLLDPKYVAALKTAIDSITKALSQDDKAVEQCYRDFYNKLKNKPTFETDFQKQKEFLESLRNSYKKGLEEFNKVKDANAKQAENQERSM